MAVRRCSGLWGTGHAQPASTRAQGTASSQARPRRNPIAMAPAPSRGSRSSVALYAASAAGGAPRSGPRVPTLLGPEREQPEASGSPPGTQTIRPQQPATRIEPRTFSYVELEGAGRDERGRLRVAMRLMAALQAHGCVFVSDIPGYEAARKEALAASVALAAVPDEVKALAQDEAAVYHLGWRRFEGSGQSAKGIGLGLGMPTCSPLTSAIASISSAASCPAADPPTPSTTVAVESLYNNPCTEGPRMASDQEARDLPFFAHPNLWPAQPPGLRQAFMALGSKLVNAGLLMAGLIDLAMCDEYEPKAPSTPPGGGHASCGVAARASLPQHQQQQQGQRMGPMLSLLRESPTHKARLAHYLPVYSPEAAGAGGQAAVDTPGASADGGSTLVWRDWHTDLSSLTAVCRPIYTSKGQEVACPDPAAGLYLKTPGGTPFKPDIPPSCAIFFLGNAAEVHTGGVLRASDHMVRVAAGPAAAGVSRHTFITFLQPLPSAPWGPLWHTQQRQQQEQQVAGQPEAGPKPLDGDGRGDDNAGAGPQVSTTGGAPSGVVPSAPPRTFADQAKLSYAKMRAKLQAGSTVV